MTTAFDSRAEALKEAAVLRSLADQVASPVVAGRKSRKSLKDNQRWQWARITNRVVEFSHGGMAMLTPESLAETWQKQCKAVGIGAGLFGWLVWNWAFPLLLELARLWIESRQHNKIDIRD